MKEVLIAILILTFLLVIGVFLNTYIIKQKFRRFIKKKYNAIRGLAQKLEAKEPIAEEEIMALIKQPGLRQAVFQVLSTYDSLDLFPPSYNTIEKGAESYLVTWLEFPTELGRAPDEIQLLTKILLEDGVSTYYVFKYASRQPKWAAKLNWMIGVAGPYHPDSSAYDVPKRLFSRFNTVGTISPDDEVKWVHENINQHQL
jgi:uncharacterized protein YneF (UPF0154 family)